MSPTDLRFCVNLKSYIAFIGTKMKEIWENGQFTRNGRHTHTHTHTLTHTPNSHTKKK